MQLKELLYGISIKSIKGNPEHEISQLAFDSHNIKQGTLFFAVKGALVDGHAFIEQTINDGAGVIVCEKFPQILKEEVTYVEVKNSRLALAIAASNFYDNPSHKLKLVGITGTNGKTTVATLLFQLFRKLNYHTGLISTVQNQIDETVFPTTNTTPNPIALNHLLNQMVKAGCQYVFMEVSSHAVVQSRIAGLNFSGGIFSNITRDHLDFHITFDNYLKAKKQFFDELPRSAFALTNLDDKNGNVILQNTKARKKTYALKQMADFQAKILENKFSGLHLIIDDLEVHFKMVGAFNAYNILAAYGATVLLEQDKLKTLTLLSSLSGAEGRFDYIALKCGIIGIVDYAHTPDAVENVLSTIANIRKGHEQLITVIGCGGDRDRGKRPIMAQTACDWSDKVILTSDNPRDEDPQSIINDMQKGVSPTNQRKVLNIPDRREAIKTAYHLANPGDIILIAGKGHEKYQEIKGVKHHFDDKEILMEQLKSEN